MDTLEIEMEDIDRRVDAVEARMVALEGRQAKRMAVFQGSLDAMRSDLIKVAMGAESDARLPDA